MAKPCEAIRLLSWIPDLAHIFSGSALSGSQNSDLNQGIRDRYTVGRRPTNRLLDPPGGSLER
jgi:hypothetical protein